MSKLKPNRYRTANWKSYNKALKKRGSLLIWFDKDMALLGDVPVGGVGVGGHRVSR